MASAERVEYRFSIDLFNGKEVPTGLRDIKVVLIREDGEDLTSRPYDLLSVHRDPSFDVMTKSDVDVLNIPPRQFVRKELAGSFDSREAVVVLTTGKWKQVEFVGEFPKRPFFGILGSKTYRKTIIEPHDEAER
jgi:xanthine/CO dehydrogenase XdhC/CoxF family maturation factor